MTKRTPEGYAVEWYFDRETEKRIFAFRESVYRLGLSPILGEMNDRPHISLALFEYVDPQQVIEITSSFVKQIYPISIQLAAIGVFPTSNNVIYLSPTPTRELLKIHTAYHRLLKKEKITSSSYYLPNHWMPHCTIEFELSDDQLNLAFQLCKKQFSPIAGTLVSLGVIAYRPVEYLAEFSIKTKENK